MPERLSFGLPGEDVGALFPHQAESGLSRSAPQSGCRGQLRLQRADASSAGSKALELPGSPSTKAHRLVGNQKDLWAATDVGLMRLNPESEEMDLYDEGAGLPNRTVTDLAVRRGRIAIATLNGVVSLGDSLKIQPVAPSFTDAALAVAFEGDTIWVGTEAGLAVALPGQGNLMQPIGLKQSPAFQSPGGRHRMGRGYARRAHHRAHALARYPFRHLDAGPRVVGAGRPAPHLCSLSRRIFRGGRAWIRLRCAQYSDRPADPDAWRSAGSGDQHRGG